jgi:hypothetical protein
MLLIYWLVARTQVHLVWGRKDASLSRRNPFVLSPQSVAIIPGTRLGREGSDRVPEARAEEARGLQYCANLRMRGRGMDVKGFTGIYNELHILAKHPFDSVVLR